MYPHSDTTVFGHNCVILANTGKECKVSPYSDDYKPIQHLTVVTGATAWTCPHSGKIYIIVFNEALCMEENLDHTLVNPNHMLHHCNAKDNGHQMP